MTTQHVTGPRGRTRTTAAALAVATLAGTGVLAVAGPAAAEVTSYGVVGDTYVWGCSPQLSASWVLDRGEYSFNGTGAALSGTIAGPQSTYEVDISTVGQGEWAVVKCVYVDPDGRPGYTPVIVSVPLAYSGPEEVAKTTPTIGFDVVSNFLLGTTNEIDVLVTANGQPATGTVRLKVDGQVWGNGYPLDGGRAWIYTTTPTRAGDHEYTIVYEGDATTEAAELTKTFHVDPLPTTVVVVGPSNATAGQPSTAFVAVNGVEYGSGVGRPQGDVEVVLTSPGQADVRRTVTIPQNGGLPPIDLPGLAAGTWAISAHYLPSDAQGAYEEKTVPGTSFTVTDPDAGGGTGGGSDDDTDPVPAHVGVPATVSTTVGSPVRIPVTLAGAPRPTTITVTESGRTLLTRKVPATGTLSLDLGVLTPGTHTLVVTTPGDDRVLASSATVTVTVGGEPAADPAAPAAQLAGSTDSATADQEIELVGRDFLPGETVVFYLHSEPVLLGTAIADANGVATLRVTLPSDVPSGAHHVRATGGTSGRTAEIALDVVAAAPADATTAPTAAADGTRLAQTGSSTAALLVLQGLLVAGGAALLVLRRRLAARA